MFLDLKIKNVIGKMDEYSESDVKSYKENKKKYL